MPITVNGEAIPEQAVQYELDRLVRFYSEHMSPDKVREQFDALKARARDQAIGAKLLMSEAERLDIRVSKTDVQERIDEMKENCGGEEGFTKQLVDQGLTEEMVREGVTRGRKMDLLVEKITAGTPEPTDGDIETHFEAHKDEYTRADRAQAQHILITAASDSDADKATARSRIDDLRSQVEGGTDFSELAAAHSDCPSGQRAGGSLGWFSRGMMVPEFDEAVFDMEIGALSDVIESSFGYHIIRKLGQEEGGPASLDDAHDQVRDFLRHVSRGEVISAYVNDLKEKATIEITD
ncbi:MAG: peptidylprolyl isomerase [Kiritimatiellia bacterium]|jgi:peptidyl-prolyl cis-trans isomerase C|nr:peptidylprolyl isomerase [Kiritimatiellia bacterium]MDP6631045.1 peptidylprolyl isomerase [Kiritimatiellia bacterium]MDP6810001.1 peptidylprolyl isomerase [Kiritimatiellia bacterium]MDP7024772.1 peptidylprolyl isomerase [Kiritimatiellia bacterium]